MQRFGMEDRNQGDAIETLLQYQYLPGVHSMRWSTNKSLVNDTQYTSGTRLETRSVLLSLVPVIPGGRTPPKTVAAADTPPNGP